MSYSRAMAEAHAFGAMFNRTPKDRSIADSIASGTLHLFPHKPWSLPDEPTWKEDPFKETNWVFQFHTLRWLDPLRRQAQSGEERFIDTWLSYAESWIKTNPPGKGVSRYSWADMVDGARSLAFSFALPVIEDLRPESLPMILASLEQHGAWLEDASHIKTGNHALQQHQGLLVLGAVLERPEWVELALQRCVDMVHEAYDDEGINEEGALQYHHMNFSWWNLIRRRFELTMGSSPNDFDRVNLAPVGMAHATRPDGRVEIIGDTEEFKMGGVDHPAVRYVHSAGSEGLAPNDLVRVFSRGYVFGRSTWGDAREAFDEAAFYSLRFGQQNQIHGHTDGMAMTLFQNGEAFLQDAGKYTYDVADPVRRYMVSREGHNSVSIVGQEYDRSTVVELTDHDDRGASQFYRFIDTGYSDSVITRRVVVSLPLRVAFIVDDVVTTDDSLVRQWWHFNDSTSQRREDSSVYVRSRSNQARLFRLEGEKALTPFEGSTKPMQGWYSPNWREKVPARTLALERTGSGPLHSLMTFDASAEGAEAQLINAEHEDVIAALVSKSDERKVTVVVGRHWGVAIPGTPSPADLRRLIDANELAKRTDTGDLQ